MIKEQEYCAICGRPKEHTHHLVYGFGKRELADQDGLIIPLCNNCHSFIHDYGVAGNLSKMLGQMKYEKDIGSREEFMKRYGRSWL